MLVGVVGAAYAARLRDRGGDRERGLGEGYSLRRIAGADHGGSVSVVCRGIRRNGRKYGYQPVRQIDVNTSETPDPDRKALQDSMPHRVLKVPGVGRFRECSKAPRQIAGGSKVGPVMAV